MLMGLFGSVGSAVSRTLTSIAQGTGTQIGDMVDLGGLAAAFDSTTSQTLAASCAKNGGLDTTNGNFVGKQWASGKIPGRLVTYSTSNGGWFNLVNGVISFYASNSAPAHAADGTLLATTGTISDATGSTQTLNVGDSGTTYTYWWATFKSSAGSGGTNATAEVQFSEWV